jgi:hypothetical protein
VACIDPALIICLGTSCSGVGGEWDGSSRRDTSGGCRSGGALLLLRKKLDNPGIVDEVKGTDKGSCEEGIKEEAMLR